jgi:hypothetical protein
MPLNARRRRAALRKLLRLHADIAVRAAGVRSAYTITFGVARAPPFQQCWNCAKIVKKCGVVCESPCEMEFRTNCKRPPCGCVAAFVQLPDSALCQRILLFAHRRGAELVFSVQASSPHGGNLPAWRQNMTHSALFADAH